MNKTNFISIVRPYSMTSLERIECLYDSLEYIRQNDIPGDFIECGVWKGGNILGIAEYLSFHKMTERKIYAFDTYSGMTTPEEVDVDHQGNNAKNIVNQPHILCYASLQDVKNNVSKTSFPQDNIFYIVGDVCETLKEKNNIPQHISLLRLDTDWYQSTKTELEILFPNLNSNGILIVDDYGHWEGSKRAVHEYFGDKISILEKIDYTGVRLFKNKL